MLWPAVFLAALRGAGAQDAPSEAHVVVVSIDGFAASRLDDEELELPNLRALARTGARAESSETVFPATDHPAHTSIITGVPPAAHGVIGNQLLNRVTGEYFSVTNRPRAESIRVPTLFDAAKRKGLTTAAFFWPETRDDPSIDWGIPLVLTGDAKANPAGSSAEFLQELREHEVPIDLFFQWYDDLAVQMSADRILARAAAYVLSTYRPNLLVVRFPAPDRYQHRYGPDHYLSKAALTASDANVGILLAAAERAGLAKTTTFFIVSDHGFHAVDRSVNVYPLFLASDLIDRVNLHSGYWSVLVELTDRFRPERDARALDDVFDRALRLPGIARVIRPEELRDVGLPRYEDDPHMLGHYLVLGDVDTRLVVDEQSESTRPVELERPIFGHAYLPSHELMRPLLLLSGRRVRQDFRFGHVRNYDVAPTVCELLGLEMTGLSGRVLDEVLEDP